MSLQAALQEAFVGTAVLTTALRGAAVGRTRMDLPFLLGTAVTEDRDAPRPPATHCTSASGSYRSDRS